MHTKSQNTSYCLLEALPVSAPCAQQALVLAPAAASAPAPRSSPIMSSLFGPTLSLLPVPSDCEAPALFSCPNKSYSYQSHRSAVGKGLSEKMTFFASNSFFAHNFFLLKKLSRPGGCVRDGEHFAQTKTENGQKLQTLLLLKVGGVSQRSRQRRLRRHRPTRSSRPDRPHRHRNRCPAHWRTLRRHGTVQSCRTARGRLR